MLSGIISLEVSDIIITKITIRKCDMMIHLNSTISLIKLNINDLNISIKRQIIRLDKKARPNYKLFARNAL